MKSRILHTSLVLNFLDVEFDTNVISEILKTEVDNILDSNNLGNLSDWEIQFKATYNNGRKLLISKNRLGSRPSDKIKEIVIIIPIPKLENASWGVSKYQYIYEESHYDKLLKNFWELNVNYSDFPNRTDYILDCMRRAIKFCFDEGFTVDGVKVNIKQ